MADVAAEHRAYLELVVLLEHPRRPVAEELGDVVKAQPAVVERRRRLISGAAYSATPSFA